MVHAGILKHCRVVVTPITVSLHDDDDIDGDDGGDKSGGDTNQGESYRDRKQVGGLGRETGVGVECAGCSVV